MFPNDIAKVASVAIKNGEWNTVDYLIGELFDWMVCPDFTTGVAADKICSCILAKTMNMKNTVQELEISNKFLKKGVALARYAEESGVYKPAKQSSQRL